MAKRPQLFYWDSCVFIALLGKEASRIKILESFVNDVQGSDGTKIIVTSEIAKVEVAFAAYERTSRKLDADFEQVLDEFWADDSVVELAEFHAQIAKDSRKFIRESIARGVKIMKPYDAVHLATAQWIDVHEFHTYNLEHYTHLADLVKFRICEPYVAQPRLIDE